MNTGEIDPTFGYDTLLEVYIGQEINSSRGILYKLKNLPIFDDEKNKRIEMLLEAKLVALKTPYAIRSIVTLVTTEIGENLRLVKTRQND